MAENPINQSWLACGGLCLDGNLDSLALRLCEARLVHHHRVRPRRQQRHDERPVRIRLYFTRQGFGALVNHLYLRALHSRSRRVVHDAVDSARRASLSLRPDSGQRARHKKHRGQ